MVIWSIIGVLTFIFILYGAVLEGRRNETREKHHPYPYRRRTLSGVLQDDLKTFAEQHLDPQNAPHQKNEPLSDPTGIGIGIGNAWWRELK